MGAKNQPVFSPAEKTRLAKLAYELYRKGYTVREVAEAAGVASSGLSKWMGQQGLAVHQQRMHHGSSNPHLPALAPIKWRDKDHALQAPLYQRSTTVPLLRQIIEVCRHDNAVVRFASDVQDARNANDKDWLLTTRATLDEVVMYLSRLSLVMSDPEARERAIRDHRERDDIAPILRIVPDV